MKNRHFLVFIILCGIIISSCGPDKRIALAEKLMADRETDSAMQVMQSIPNPSRRLSDRDYALYALLMSEAINRKGKLNAATDTLLLPAIDYFSKSGDSLLAERALFCKAQLDRRLHRLSDAMKSFLKALSFLKGSNNHDQLYKVNTWLGVICMFQGEYAGQEQYAKAALTAAINLGNNFYKNMALCDVATSFFFQQKADSSLLYAQRAYDAALVDSLPQQLTHIYTNLATTYNLKGEHEKALSYINKAIALRPTKDTLAILGLYANKLDLFGKIGQYDSAYYYYQQAIKSTDLPTRANAVKFMAAAYAQAGRNTDAYALLSKHVQLADSVTKQRHTEENIALQELYHHEQLSIENLYWRTQAAEKQSKIFWMIIVSLLLLWGISTIYIIYRRQLLKQKSQLIDKQEQLLIQQNECSENQQRIIKMQQKELQLKSEFFRGLSRHIVEEINKGKNIILTEEDWDDIVRNADIIFDGFTQRLQQAYPTLNKEDLHYCCMVKMQLSQSEMSQIMHLEKDSVKKRLKRVRVDKMKADSGVTLEELLRNF